MTGAAIIFRMVWERLGLDRYLKVYLQDHKIEFDAEEIIYTLALNRLMEPKSELATHKWAKNVYGIKESSTIVKFAL